MLTTPKFLLPAPRQNRDPGPKKYQISSPLPTSAITHSTQSAASSQPTWSNSIPNLWLKRKQNHPSQNTPAQGKPKYSRFQSLTSSENSLISSHPPKFSCSQPNRVSYRCAFIIVRSCKCVIKQKEHQRHLQRHGNHQISCSKNRKLPLDCDGLNSSSQRA